METKRITTAEALKIITNSEGKFFAVEFARVNPKCDRCETTFNFTDPSVSLGVCQTAFCHVCNRKLTKSENGTCKVCKTKATECNGTIELTRKMTGRLGVKNPGEGITKPGTGLPSATGGFEERLARPEPLVTVYDVTVEKDRTDGKAGGYRCFRLSTLINLTADGVSYEIAS